MQWYLGDALAYGERRFGESYAQISATLEQHGLHVAPGTLANHVWVSTRVPPSRRREDLPWSFHAEVAKLEPERQDDLLARAAAEGWTRSRLREEIRGPKELPAARGVGDLGVGCATPTGERLIDVARLIVHTCLPDKEGCICVPVDLFDRLAAALGEGAP